MVPGTLISIVINNQDELSYKSSLSHSKNNHYSPVPLTEGASVYIILHSSCLFQSKQDRLSGGPLGTDCVPLTRKHNKNKLNVSDYIDNNKKKAQSKKVFSIPNAPFVSFNELFTCSDIVMKSTITLP